MSRVGLPQVSQTYQLSITGSQSWSRDGTEIQSPRGTSFPLGSLHRPHGQQRGRHTSLKIIIANIVNRVTVLVCYNCCHTVPQTE